TTNSGRHTDYLTETKVDYRSCDEELFDALRRVAFAPRRHIGFFETEAVMPSGTTWVRDPITFLGPAAHRRAARKAWLDSTLAGPADDDFVFFDPDNGLEISSVAMGSLNDHRFVFYSELAPFVERGQSIGVYQHATRRDTIEEQARRRAAELRTNLGVEDV